MLGESILEYLDSGGQRDAIVGSQELRHARHSIGALRMPLN